MKYLIFLLLWLSLLFNTYSETLPLDFSNSNNNFTTIWNSSTLIENFSKAALVISEDQLIKNTDAFLIVIIITILLLLIAFGYLLYWLKKEFRMMSHSIEIKNKYLDILPNDIQQLKANNQINLEQLTAAIKTQEDIGQIKEIVKVLIRKNEEDAKKYRAASNSYKETQIIIEDLKLSDFGVAIEQPKAPEIDLEDLTQIYGIGHYLQKRLKKMNITSIEQITKWSKADINSIGKALEHFPERIEFDDWVGQAKQIMRQVKPEQEKIDLNDLKLVSGIGPKYEKVLNHHGIKTLNDLAKTSIQDLLALCEELKVKPEKIKNEDWIEQAKKFLMA